MFTKYLTGKDDLFGRCIAYVLSMNTKSMGNVMECGRLDSQEGGDTFQWNKRQLNPDILCETKRVKTGPPQ